MPELTKQERREKFRKTTPKTQSIARKVTETKVSDADEKVIKKNIVRPMGRPEILDDEMKVKICDMIADNYYLMEIADEIGVSQSTIKNAIRRDENFRREYVLAREAAAEFMVERMILVAIGKDPLVVELEMDERKMVLDTIKWIAGKMLHSVYGDKVKKEISGPNGGPVQIEAQVIDMDLPEEVEDALLEVLEGVDYVVE